MTIQRVRLAVGGNPSPSQTPLRQASRLRPRRARAVLVEGFRAFGLATQDTFVVTHNGRTWYPMAADRDWIFTPIGSAESAAELLATVEEVDRIARPGAPARRRPEGPPADEYQ